MKSKKLSITLDPKLKEQARRNAQARGLSISEYIRDIIRHDYETNYNNDLESNVANNIRDAAPDHEKLADYDYDTLKEDALRDKYDF